MAWAYGLVPVFLFAMTWEGQSTPLGYAMRAYGLPILAVQLCFSLIWFGKGFRLHNLAPLPVLATATLFSIALITAIQAPDRLEATIRMVIWTTQIGFAFTVVGLWQRRAIDLDHFRIAITAGFLLVFLMLVVFVATIEQTAEERTNSLPAFGHIRWFGEYAAGVFGLCAFGFLRGDRFSLVVATVAVAMAFWTGTRGAVVAIALGLAACAALYSEFRSPRVWLLLALSGFAGFLVARGLDTLVPIAGHGIGRMASLDSSGRISFWLRTLELIQLRPQFGWGDGQFRFLLGDTWNLGHPHNSVIQVLFAWGIVGTLLCAALAAWSFPRFVRVDQAKFAPFCCAALILAAYSLTDGTLYLVQPLSLFVLCATLTVAAGSKRKLDAS